MASAVAPYTGAWIETRFEVAIVTNIQSHPTRVRGLKQKEDRIRRYQQYVAPYTGAWIETAYE